MYKIKILILTIIVSALFGILAGRGIWRAVSPPLLPPARHPLNSLVSVTHKAADSENIFARKAFFLPYLPVSAVIYMNAYENFILFVNGRRAGWSADMNVFREFHQNMPLIRYNLPWHPSVQSDISRGKEWLYIFDITSLLKIGKNVLAVQVKSPSAPAAFAVHCAVVKKNREQVRIITDATWKINRLPLIKSGRDWFMPNFDDTEWETADILTASVLKSDLPKCYMDHKIYSLPFEAPFITHPHFPSRELFFRYNIFIPSDAEDFWIRFISNTNAHIFLNGNYVSAHPRSKNLIGAYDLIQYIIAGKPNSIAVRLEPSEQHPPVCFAMDGCVSGKYSQPLFFRTDPSWKVSSLISKDWTTCDDFGYNIVSAAIFKDSPLYKNTGYIKEYKGVIPAKHIPEQLLVFIIAGTCISLLVNLSGIFLINRIKQDIRFSYVSGLIFACLPGMFFLLSMALIESKKFITSAWVIFMYPKFWQISMPLVIFATIMLYYRFFCMISHNDS